MAIHWTKFKDDKQIAAVLMLLSKRAPFSHEEEVRLLRYCKEPQDDELFKYDIHDLGTFIQEITLDPWSPDGYEDAIKAIVDKYLPGNTIPVLKSDLYKKIEKGLLYDPFHYYGKKKEE